MVMFSIMVRLLNQRLRGQEAWRTSDDSSALERLTLRLQAALYAEQERHIRIAVIGTGTAWVCFCGLLARRAYEYVYLPGQWRQNQSHMESAPLAGIFVFTCAFAMRPTDRYAMRFVCVLTIAFGAYVTYEVRDTRRQPRSLG